MPRLLPSEGQQLQFFFGPVKRTARPGDLRIFQPDRRSLSWKVELIRAVDGRGAAVEGTNILTQREGVRGVQYQLLATNEDINVKAAVTAIVERGRDWWPMLADVRIFLSQFRRTPSNQLKGASQ